MTRGIFITTTTLISTTSPVLRLTRGKFKRAVSSLAPSALLHLLAGARGGLEVAVLLHICIFSFTHRAEPHDVHNRNVVNDDVN